MNQKKVLTYCLKFALSNKYLEVIIQSLEPKIFTQKVEASFYKIKKFNHPSIFSLNILDSRYCIMTSKCLFDRAQLRQ